MLRKLSAERFAGLRGYGGIAGAAWSGNKAIFIETRSNGERVMRTTSKVGTASLVSAMLLAAGCGGGGDNGAVTVATTATVAATTTTAAPTTTTAAPTTTTTTVATTTTTTFRTTAISQSGAAYPQPVPDAAPTGWQTAEALKIKDNATGLATLKLIEQRDSSGPDAWTPPAHGIVYLVTNNAGLGGFYARDWVPSRVPPMIQSVPDCLKVVGGVADISTCANPIAPIWTGLALFDGNSKANLASVQFPDLGPSPQAHALGNEAHGIGASGDGKWFYLIGTDSRSTLGGKIVMNIVNARTLKVDKILQTSPHHVTSFKYGWDKTATGAADPLYGKDLVMISGNGAQQYVLDPSTNAAGYSNTVVKALSPSDLLTPSTYSHVDQSGKYMFVSVQNQFVLPSGAGSGGIAVISLQTMKVVNKVTFPGGESQPYMVIFSANGKYAYVSGGISGYVGQIDMTDPSPANWVMAKRASAQVTKPYGLTMSWNDNVLMIMPKGTGGKSQTIGMTPAAGSFGGNGIGQAYLNGCNYPDHAVVHPDPTLNEMWVSCNNSGENIVMNMGDGKATGDMYSYLPKKFFVDAVKNPNGNVENPGYGSAHNGAFIKYTVSGTTWTGEVQSDTGGLHGAALVTYKAKAAAAGN